MNNNERVTAEMTLDPDGRLRGVCGECGWIVRLRQGLRQDDQLKVSCCRHVTEILLEGKRYPVRPEGGQTSTQNATFNELLALNGRRCKTCSAPIFVKAVGTGLEVQCCAHFDKVGANAREARAR